MALLAPAASGPASRAASSGVLAVLLAFVPLTFVACGDDGSVLGWDGGAGSMSGGSAGTANSGGSGHAGTQTNAGNSSGGTANNGGTVSNGGSASNGGAVGNAGSGNGGTASCNIGECVRANVCLDHCGGSVVYSGCCACAANTVEQLSCDNAGGQGSGGQGSGGQGSGGQGSTDCVGTTCTASQTCVAYRTVGGAIFPPDTEGMCMTRMHLEGDRCQADFAYTCAELTGCAAPSNTCRCAPGTACANTTVCKLPTASTWLDTSADLVCELLAP